MVTFCHSSATPCAAEEGLTGVLGEGREDSVGCHAQWKDFTPEEVGISLSLLLSLAISHYIQAHYCTHAP